MNFEHLIELTFLYNMSVFTFATTVLIKCQSQCNVWTEDWNWISTFAKFIIMFERYFWSK